MSEIDWKILRWRAAIIGSSIIFQSVAWFLLHDHAVVLRSFWSQIG